MSDRLQRPLAQHEPRQSRSGRLLRSITLAHGLVLTTLIGLALTAGTAFADVSVSPTAPPGAAALQDLINWGGYTGAATCLGGAIYGFGKMGLAHKDGNYGASNHGRTVAMMSLAGALGLGIAPTVINTLTGVH